MFQVVHEVPGRLRVRSAALRHDPALGVALAARLDGRTGVLSATVSPRTGSLLIRHDGAPGRAEALRGELAASPVVQRPGRAGAGRVAERVTAALLEYLAQRMLGAVAAALI